MVVRRMGVHVVRNLCKGDVWECKSELHGCLDIYRSTHTRIRIYSLTCTTPSPMVHTHGPASKTLSDL